MRAEDLLDREARSCFDFFRNEANADRSGPGYGLVRDRDDPAAPCSIALVEFGLDIGAQRGWVPRDAARHRRSEASVIDTAPCVAGALAASEYFGGGARDLADQLYRRVEWPWYRDPASNRFRMG